MSRKQQQVAWLAGLLVVCAVVYRRAPAPHAKRNFPQPLESQKPRSQPTDVGGPQSAPTEQPLIATPPASADPATMAAVRAEQRLRAASLGWNHDPFLHGDGAGDMSGLLLSGILWDPHEPMAVINGQPVRIGAQLDGYRVTSITEHQVVISDGAQTFQLNLSQ